MFRKTDNRNTFDPSHFNDPVAMQTDWTPAKGGGTNFSTHNLAEVSHNRMEFRASIGARLFYLIFLLAGLRLLIGFSVSKLLSGEFYFDIELIMTMFAGLVFALAGGSMLYYGTAPVVFDKWTFFFWKGRKKPDFAFGTNTLKHSARLDKIHALQLISEYCRGNKSSYYSYELNLVLEDGERINVVDHGNQDKLREDAGTLSAFLEKPVWDAI